MTGSYLEKLRALKSENEAVGALSKLTKPRPSAVVVPDSTTDGGFDSFDSTQGAGFSNFSALYSRTIAALESRCPDLVPVDRWRLAIDDGRRLLALWGDQAQTLRWTARDLFGLPAPPAKPHPSYSRLSRYDETGLIWLLQGRQVAALTEATAAIQSSTGAITIYRRHNKPALGPVGDCLATSSRRSAGMPHDHR
jgi:hypothetical protein